MSDIRASVRDTLSQLITAPDKELPALARAHLTPDTIWDVAFPIDRLLGVDAVLGAHQHQDTLTIVLKPRAEINAIGPNINIAFQGKIAALPALVLILPNLDQAPNGRRWKASRLRAEKNGQGFLELPGRNTFQGIVKLLA